jgi:alcohol dehydrogenase class IV
MYAMAHAQTQALRLCDVIQAVSDVAANEQETLATVVHLLSSGQVQLSAHAMQAIRELLVTTSAAA